MSEELPELSECDDDIDEGINSVNTETKGYRGEDIAYFYDPSTPPTFIEFIFGEPYHIGDEYPSHQITYKLILTLMCESIVTGSILWLQIAIRYYLISLWSIGPSQFVGILSVVQIPFTIRILYGLLIDSVSFFGYKRKSYLFLFGIIAILSSFGLIYFRSSFIIQIFCLCIRSFCIAFCDVIISAITVERSEYKSHSVAIRLQCLNYFSMYVVSACGLIIAANIEQSQTPNDIIYVYWIYFCVTFLIIIGAILLPEHKQKNQQKHSQSHSHSIQRQNAVSAVINDNDHHIDDEYDDLIQKIQLFEQIDNNNDLRIENNDKNIMIINDRPQYTLSQILSLTFETFCRKIVFYPLLFTFLMSAMPRSNQAIDYFLMYKLGFDSNKIGYLQIVSSIAFLLSVIIITIHSKSKTFSLRSLFATWTFIAATIPYSSLLLIFGIYREYGISDFIFTAMDTIIVRITIDMLLLGTAVLYARICPPGIEGVFFTLLTSIATIGEVISYIISALFMNVFNIQCVKINYNQFDGLNLYNNNNNNNNINNPLICDFDNLWLLIIAVNLTTLIPLMWIFWVPNEQQMKHISITLRKSAANQLNVEVETNDNVLMRGSRKYIHDKDMISLYFICIDHLFPFLKHFIFACCIKKKHIDNNDGEGHIH